MGTTFQDSDWTLEKGQMIAGRYEIVREIGRGGMGAVFEARDRSLERTVAIKFLDPDRTQKPKALERFQLEAVAAGRIDHEGICDVRDRGVTDDGLAFIVMELLEGESLLERLAREPRLSPQAISEVLLPVLDALGAAHHKGIVHRDLKPENIFLVAGRGPGEPLKIKLLDFGLSRFLDEKRKNRLTTVGKVLGSPSYMSPEQARGKADVDHRADIWAIGVILFQALTGFRPFRGDNYNDVLVQIVTESPTRPSALNPAIPPSLDSVVVKALAKDRNMRFSTAAEFTEALCNALADPAAVLRSPKPPSGEEGGPGGAATDASARSPRPRQPAPFVPAAGRATSRAGRPVWRYIVPVAVVLVGLAIGALVSARLVAPRLQGAGDEPTNGTAERERLDDPVVATTGSRPQHVPPENPATPAATAAAPLVPAAGTPSTPLPRAPATVAAPAQPPPAPLPASPRATTIALRVRAHPPYAHIRIDGAAVDGNPWAGSYPVDTARHRLNVSAPGYLDHAQFVAFDHDQEIEVRLERDPRRRR